MKIEKILNNYLLLPKKEKKVVNIILIIFIVFILYLIFFFIAKGVLVNKAKDFLVEKGVGTDKKAITLKISVDPFTVWGGRVHKLNLKVDKIQFKNLTYIYDFNLQTKSLNFYKLKSIEDGLSVGANFSFELHEDDFLSLVNERINRISYLNLNITSQNGQIIFSSFGTQSVATPYLNNNAIYLKIDANFFDIPLKIIDFGLLSKNRINIYNFQYEKGKYIFNGTLI